MQPCRLNTLVICASEAIPVLQLAISTWGIAWSGTPLNAVFTESSCLFSTQHEIGVQSQCRTHTHTHRQKKITASLFMLKTFSVLWHCVCVCPKNRARLGTVLRITLTAMHWFNTNDFTIERPYYFTELEVVWWKSVSSSKNASCS